MTDRQEMFCKEYLIDLNATQAAIRAGYSEKTARQIGDRLLTNVDIKNQIQILMDERSKRVEIDGDRVLQELAKIGFADIKNYLEYKTVKTKCIDETTKESYIDYRMIVDTKDSSEVDGSLISEVSIGKDGTFKFKLYDKLAALEKLGKHLELFVDKTKSENTNNNTNINFNDDKEILKQLREKLKKKSIDKEE